IDPIGLIDRYGADALRFTLAAMAAQGGRDIKLAESRVEGHRNFATKLWNAARFAEINGCARNADYDPLTVRATLNRWILGEAARAVNEVSAAIETFRFNDAASAAYRFIWNVFCDWCLELAKPVLQGADSPEKEETQATIAYVLDDILKLLHPFMPFLTEELWAATAGAAGRPQLLAVSAWPTPGDLDGRAAEDEIGWLIELVLEIRSVRSETGVPAGAQLPLVLVEASPAVALHARTWEGAIKRLARISEITFADAAPAGSAQIFAGGGVAALPMAGVVDLTAERGRLAKERDKELKEVERIDAKLANADFLNRAPEEVIEENRERRELAVARIAKIEAALARIGTS
ncbi:MAG TPA: class I tRNA ligase family protein, partial [Roseiarcus sp.]|nr:class I tRNA ligase family protein [Roseiarcus sp.]